MINRSDLLFNNDNYVVNNDCTTFINFVRLFINNQSDLLFNSIGLLVHNGTTNKTILLISNCKALLFNVGSYTLSTIEHVTYFFCFSLYPCVFQIQPTYNYIGATKWI